MIQALSVTDLPGTETAGNRDLHDRREKIAVGSGHILVVPAGAAHGFLNSGDSVLRLVTIQPSDHVIQEWLED